MPTKRSRIHESEPNIFADLGRPDADTHMLKSQIVAELYRLTKDRNLNQTEAGVLMGLSQPEVSRLFKGTFREYSVERLMRMLTLFAHDVEIVVRPQTEVGKGRILFSPASITAEGH